jgi:hypothetical protein
MENFDTETKFLKKTNTLRKGYELQIYQIIPKHTSKSRETIPLNAIFTGK